MYKQVIVVRDDLKMSKGKLSVQVAHASLSSAQKSNKKILKSWEKEGQKKVVVKVKNLSLLLRLKEKSKKLGIKSALVSDAGLTELEPGTITALGIGPDKEEIIDKITGSLDLV